MHNLKTWNMFAQVVCMIQLRCVDLNISYHVCRKSKWDWYYDEKDYQQGPDKRGNSASCFGILGKQSSEGWRRRSRRRIFKSEFQWLMFRIGGNLVFFGAFKRIIERCLNTRLLKFVHGILCLYEATILRCPPTAVNVCSLFFLISVHKRVFFYPLLISFVRNQDSIAFQNAFHHFWILVQFCKNSVGVTAGVVNVAIDALRVCDSK